MLVLEIFPEDVCVEPANRRPKEGQQVGDLYYTQKGLYYNGGRSQFEGIIEHQTAQDVLQAGKYVLCGSSFSENWQKPKLGFNHKFIPLEDAFNHFLPNKHIGKS